MKKFKGLFKGKGASGSQSDLKNTGLSSKNGYEVKEKDLPKLHKAAWNGDIAKVKNLAKKDVNSLDKENRTPLHLACVAGHAAVVQELLEWHANPNKGDQASKTPLMKAVECNQEECVKLLLEYRAEVNVADRESNTALHLAAKEGYANIVALLISAESKLNLKNKEGFTPLHLSVLDTSKKDEIARLLLENGASPNEVDRNSRTPLHHACHEDSINHVKLLLKFNADTFIKDSKGWSAEDCAMMKANHGCSQLVYDHNLKQQKKTPGGSSVQSTPRNPPSIISQSTPREPSAGSDMFGMPQQEIVHDDDDSDDATSKISGTPDNQESWGDDTDISSAYDDPKGKKVNPKISLTKNVNLSTEESDPENLNHNELNGGAMGGRVMYSRTPTPTSPGVSPSPNFGNSSSKIPVRKQTDGQSDDDDDDDSSPLQRNRVSFNDKEEVRQFASPTDDDTDIDDDIGVEPLKKRRIQTPEEEVNTPYLPTGVSIQSQNKMSEEKRKALMRTLGMDEDDGDDEEEVDFNDEDVEEISEAESPRDPNQPTSSQQNTPRGILKQPKNVNDKPPSVHQRVESDPYWESDEDDDNLTQPKEIIVKAEINLAAVIPPDQPVEKEEESDWDSTRHSDVERHPSIQSQQAITRTEQVIEVHSGDESPEVDSDLEDTLNPEHSTVEKDKTEPDEITDLQESNTRSIEIVQVSTTTPETSTQDKLANTGDINALVINELNESMDVSNQGSNPSSFAAELAMAMIEEEKEKAEVSESEARIELSQTTKSQSSLKTVIRRVARDDRVGESIDSDDETIDKIEISHQGPLDELGSTLQGTDDLMNTLEGIDDERIPFDRRISTLCDDVNNPNEIQNEGYDYDDNNADSIEKAMANFDEIEELISSEIEFYDNKDKQEEASTKEEKSKSLKDEKSAGEERSLKAVPASPNLAQGRVSGASMMSGDGQVIDRNSAPRCLFDYEPSTTEADSELSEDSDDTLEDEPLHDDVEEIAEPIVNRTVQSIANKKTDSSNTSSINMDKEVARALREGSSDTASKLESVIAIHDVNRESVEPNTQNTMDDQASLVEELDEDETSQWDSAEDYTPRTPREFARLGSKAISPEVKDLEFEEEEEDIDEIDDQIEEAVTAFNTSSPAQQTYIPSIPSNQTPEPLSDSSHLRTPSTPDPPTSSTSAALRTVITARQEEPVQVKQEVDRDSESDWDSEDDIQSDVEGQDQNEDLIPQNETPRTARSDASRVTVSEEESASEWELERQREKQRQQDEADRRMKEEEENAKKEEEKRILEELEEEEERQRLWEEDEQRRQEQLKNEVAAELEREIRESQDISEVSDFDDEDEENILPHDDDDAYLHEELEAKNQDSDHQVSEKSEASEELVRSHSSARSYPLSPRNLELKKPPPKLVVSKFIQSPKAVKNPVQMGEVENESPAFFGDSSPGPGYEDHIVPAQSFSNQSTPSLNDIIEPVHLQQVQTISPPVEFKAGQEDKAKIQMISPPFEFKVDTVNEDKKETSVEDSDQDVDDFGDEDEESEPSGVQEVVQPVEKPVVTAVFLTQSELPKAEPKETKHNGRVDAVDISPPKLPLTAPPVKAMSLQSDGHSPDEDEDLEDSPRSNKPTTSSPYNLPDYSGTTGLYKSGLEIPFDDDGLSVTSTENGDISTSYRPENLPYGKDMLVNMNLNDSHAVLKLQEHLREHRRQLEHERGQRMLVENKHQLITKEKSQLQKSIDSLKYQKSALEQNKLDLEAKIRNLEYQVNEEEEKRKNSELLLNKTKDHLAKKEEQFAQEMEAKQRAELAMRNIQTELRSAQNQIKDLEEEREELERLLGNERNARQLQEKINEEQQRLQQHINEEAFNMSSQREEDGEDAESALELAGVDIKQAKDLIEKIRNENAALKAEIQRQRLRLTEENSSLTLENEKLQQKVEDLKNEVRLNEEALTQYTVQQNLHHSKMVSESTMLNNSLDKERVVREKLEAELESSKSRLQATVVELEKSQQARNEFERRLHSDREDWARQLERKDQEMASIKDKLNSLMHTLNETESKLNSVENELQISNTTLLERTNQQQQLQRDLQFYKTSQENHDSHLRHEKEQNAKLVGKVESLQDRLSNLQHDNLSLKQQVDLAQHSANDRSGVELQDKLNVMIGSLKSDHEKARSSLEDKNNNLQDTITRLREEMRNSENRRSNLEQDIRRLNQDQNDLVRKLSIAEASLDVAQKARDHLEQERVAMKMEMEKLQQRYQTAQEKTIESHTRMSELAERLDKTEQGRLMSNQQLADTSATMAAFNNSKSELEENYQKLQVENVRLDAELKHEKQKAEMLYRDLLDSQKVRSSLEALCSNLKSTNAHLEEKLGPDQLQQVTASGEVTNRAQLQKEMEEHKGLWEQEVLSRSKLGLRIAQLDKHKQETHSHLEEEKRKTRKALEQKRLAESKLESEQEKCANLQKEVVNLKAYLKVAKKKLKELGGEDAMDTNETRVNHLHSAFDNERRAMEDMMVSVKAQLEHMKLQLQEEVDEKERIQHKNVQLENELKTIKKLEKSVQKIDRSKRKLEKEFETYKSNVEAGYTDKASVEESKREIEARYRQELNRKLDEVNNYLEEQARTRNKLDTSREEQEGKLRFEKKKLEEEVTDLRIRYEQSSAKLESKEMEAKRFRDLYESEMQWRMKLSEQLYRSTDKVFSFKNNSERQRSRMYGSLTNLTMNSMNGQAVDLSRINGSLAEDALGNKLRAELDRSIAKHLEAAPHDQMSTMIRGDDPSVYSSNFAKANSDYIELLKRKYCV